MASARSASKPMISQGTMPVARRSRRDAPAERHRVDRTGDLHQQAADARDPAVDLSIMQPGDFRNQRISKTLFIPICDIARAKFFANRFEVEFGGNH